MTTILAGAIGAPGTARLLRALRENGEREVRLVGVDMSERSIGRHLCDAFHLVPPGNDPGYVDALLEIVEREGADIVLPQSSHDLQPLADRRAEFPVPVLVSDPETVRRSNDKAETYQLLHRIGVPAPEFRRVRGAAGVAEAARELATPSGRSASSPSSPPARGASASSTRRSTGRTSSCTSAPARSRCASRRRSSCSPTTGSTCS